MFASIILSAVLFFRNKKTKNRNEGGENTSLPQGNTFEKQKEVDYRGAIENEQSSLNPKFHRTEREEDLSFNFSSKYSDEIQKLENSIYLQVSKIHNIGNIDDKITQCRLAINVFEKAKNFCYNKGKGGTIYFQDMWEHLHNSKNPDFSYIESIEEELDFMINNYQEASEKIAKDAANREKRERINSFKKSSNELLLKFISENDGVLQKDIYKEFDIEYTSAIKSTLKYLTDNGKIMREKAGSTYRLTINK